MKLRTSRILVIGAFLVALHLPATAAFGVTRDQADRDGRFSGIVRIVKIIKKILKVSPQEEWPGGPKP